MRNLKHCIERSHLSVAGVAAAGYRQRKAVITEGEAQTGVTCLDMGAGRDGRLGVLRRRLDLLRLRRHAAATTSPAISPDAFSVTLAEAERMKTLHASVFAAGARLDRRYDYG